MVHGRHQLPWRQTKDPYAIYLSEIMLQQTQVDTVLSSYYEPFLARFPTLQALADAEEEEVLSLWQGLGYYRRAKHLHKAAKLAAPVLPKTVEGMLALPGVGKNTAHAVLSFAYEQPLPVLEANVKRVLMRVAAISHFTEALWEIADSFMDKEDPFVYNQAMMDIGSMLCTPKNPNCTACPLSSDCLGQMHPESYPAKKARKLTHVRKKDIYVLQNREGYVQMIPRKTAFLGGLYGFLEMDRGAPTTFSDICKLGHITQTYSHFKLDANVYLVRDHAIDNKDFYSLHQAKKLPMSRADEKVIALLETSRILM